MWARKIAKRWRKKNVDKYGKICLDKYIHYAVKNILRWLKRSTARSWYIFFCGINSKTSYPMYRVIWRWQWFVRLKSTNSIHKLKISTNTKLWLYSVCDSIVSRKCEWCVFTINAYHIDYTCEANGASMAYARRTSPMNVCSDHWFSGHERFTRKE